MAKEKNMQELEKECERCGAFFKTTNARRKYCDKCSANYNSMRREYETGMRESLKRMYEPDLTEITCDVC